MDKSFVGTILDGGGRINFFCDGNCFWTESRSGNSFLCLEGYRKGRGDGLFDAFENLKNQYQREGIRMYYDMLDSEKELLAKINEWLKKDSRVKNVPSKIVRVTENHGGYLWTVELTWFGDSIVSVPINVWRAEFAEGYIEAARIAEATIEDSRRQMSRGK